MVKEKANAAEAYMGRRSPSVPLHGQKQINKSTRTAKAKEKDSCGGTVKEKRREEKKGQARRRIHTRRGRRSIRRIITREEKNGERKERRTVR